MGSTLFERFNVPALFLAKDATLAAFSCGKTSALVVDVGHGSTCVTPIYDGFALAQGTVYSALAGERLDAELTKRLQAKQAVLAPRYTVQKKEIRPGVFEAVS